MICGQATVLLLGVGSIVLAATREGASRGIVLDDIRVFFERPALIHAWFYLLLGVMVVYAVNTFLATWHSLSAKLRAGVGQLSEYAPSLFHIAFLIALLAHLVGGLRSEELDAVVLDGAWRELEPGVDARVVALESSHYPDGMLRQVSVAVEVREDGRVETVDVGYNRPLSRDLGTDLYIIARTIEDAPRVVVREGERTCEVGLRGRCVLMGHQVILTTAALSGHWGPFPVARFQGPGGVDLLLSIGGPEMGPTGPDAPRLESIDFGPAMVMRHRKTAGNPLALLSALIMLAGIALMGRRWAR